jgi:hypothetical protein
MLLGVVIGLLAFGLLAGDAWIHRNPVYSCAVAQHDSSYWEEYGVDTESLEIDGSWQLLPTGLTCTYPTNDDGYVNVAQSPGLTIVFFVALGATALAVGGAIGTVAVRLRSASAPTSAGG